VGNMRRVTIKLSQLLKKKKKLTHCEEDEFIRHLIVQLLNVYFGALCRLWLELTVNQNLLLSFKVRLVGIQIFLKTF